MKLRVVLLNLMTCTTVVGVAGGGPAWAQSGAAPASMPTSPVWRCGQLLTNQPQPGQGCEPLASVSSTVVDGTRAHAQRAAPAVPGAEATAGQRGLSAGATPWAPSAASAASHQQARTLLQAELREQEQRWQQLQAQWNQGRPLPTLQQPEGSPAYRERVAALREQLHRTEADVAALRRELARWPGTN